MNNPLRILALTAYLPWHGHGGGLLIGNMLRQLSQHHSVTLLSFVERGEKQHLPEVANLCHRLITVPVPQQFSQQQKSDTQTRSLTQSVLARMRGTLSTRPRDIAHRVWHLLGLICAGQQKHWPTEVARLQTPDFRAALVELIQECVFDVVMAEWPEMVPYGDMFPRSVVKIHDSIELRSLTYRRRFLAQRSIKPALFWYLQWKRMQHLEALATKTFEVVTAVSSREARILERYGGPSRIVTVPLGLDLACWPREDSTKRWANTLIFLGRMSYAPNQDAVRHFISHIYPHIRSLVPDVRLLVIGGNPPADIALYDGWHGVRVTGYVTDVSEYLLRGTVFVLPIRQGAGIKVKALEAMAAGIPIVTTRLGCEGLDYVQPGRDLIVARSARHFARETAELLRNQTRRYHIARNARRVVHEHYDCAKNVAYLEALHIDEVEKRRIET